MTLTNKQLILILLTCLSIFICIASFFNDTQTSGIKIIYRLVFIGFTLSIVMLPYGKKFQKFLGILTLIPYLFLFITWEREPYKIDNILTDISSVDMFFVLLPLFLFFPSLFLTNTPTRWQMIYTIAASLTMLLPIAFSALFLFMPYT